MDLEPYRNYRGPGLPWSVGQAMAFRTFAELVRRHPDRDLRVVLLHPGSGQYHCVTLMEGRFERTRVMWNLAGTSLVIGTEDLEWPTLLTHHAQPVLLAERILGWEPSDEETLPSLSLAVVAELASRYAMASKKLRLDCGWYDSSGYDCCRVRPWAACLEHIGKRLRSAGDDWQLQAAAGARIWGIIDEEADEPLVRIDIPSGKVFDRAGHAHWSIVDEYGKGAGIRAMAWRLEQCWRKGFGEAT